MITHFPPVNSLAGHSNLSEKELELVNFLYEEGPHKIADIVQIMGYGETWTINTLDSLMHQGVVEKARLTNERTSYWLYHEVPKQAQWG
jgi:predicted transcriptional regulator